MAAGGPMPWHKWHYGFFYYLDGLHPMSIEFIPMVYLEPGWTGIYDMAYE